MRSFFVNLILIAALQPFAAYAGSVSITVSDTKSSSCLHPDATDEQTQYLLTSQETIVSLNHYFHGIANPQLYDAAIVNAQIGFCSQTEKKEVLSAIVGQFDQPQVSKRLLEVATNYYRSRIMQQLIHNRLNSDQSSPQLKTNLHQLIRFANRRLRGVSSAVLMRSVSSCWPSACA